ncbi:hypothetical protein PG997_004951 [Apiospora hydei]|uniref:Peroxisomal membrane protein PEX17 n=1 Tax=Apiospora hydei TaxID=1337664 RepID=A0ABR1X3K3_9PEZI
MSSADRLLTTTLRAYQEPHRPADLDRLHASTATLLSNLNNHLNISLLTSHLLTARAIWGSPSPVYNTAALHVQRNEAENAKLKWGQQPVGSGVRCDAWARAVAKGADDRSERWKHLLVLTGTLMGMESEDRRALSRGLRATLEQAVVTAANLALETINRRVVPTGELGSNAAMLALAYVFPVLSDHHKQMLNCDSVLPAAVRAMIGPEGFQNGDFLRSISAGNVAGHETFYRASPSSFAQVQQLEARPLPQNMGPLSRLTAFAVYVFTYLTSLDIITRYPDACVRFLREAQPAVVPGQPNSQPLTPLDQARRDSRADPGDRAPLRRVIALASRAPDVAHPPLYEAAHAAILSVLCCPQHATLTIALIPFYIETLLASFPARISPRQFRLAFKTVVQIASPPFPIAASHPHLAETLLEMLHFRSATAMTYPLPAEPGTGPGGSGDNVMTGDQQQPLPPVSEQTTLDWLTRTAEAMNAVVDPALREVVRKRFWDVLVSGEMDVERAAIGVAWWGIGGGREMVLLNQPALPKGDGEAMMSGALGGNRLEASRL